MMIFGNIPRCNSAPSIGLVDFERHGKGAALTFRYLKALIPNVMKLPFLLSRLALALPGLARARS
jgi:hypothetical protein